MTVLAGHGKDPRLVQTELPIKKEFKVGDRVKDSDGFIGVISLINNKCINVKGKNSTKSWSLEKIKCLPISIISEELEHSPLQPETLEKSRQSPTSTSTTTRKKSINPTSKKSQSIPISETIPHREELTSLQEDSLVQGQAPQVQKQGWITKNLNSGLSISDVSEKGSPDLQLSKIPQDYSIAEWEQSSKAYPKAGTMQSGKLSALPCLEAPKSGKEFLSLPTLMTGLGNGRNAGATKCEKYLKDKGILPSTQALSPQMMALLFNFPPNWTECLWESPKEAEEGTTSENSLGGQSMSTVQPSHSNESSISIAPLVKARVNKTTIEVPKDIAPIFKLAHTVGINIVNLNLLDLINSLSTDRLRLAVEISETHGGCQKKRTLLVKHIKERENWDKYLNNCNLFPVGSKVKIIDTKRSSGVWTGCTGIVQPYKQNKNDAASIGYGIIVKIFSESSQEFVNPIFQSCELISQNNIDAKSDFPLERLAFLQSERDRLIASGASPKGIWLEKSKPSGKDFIQVVWKSDKARPEWGDRKSKYIGKENSDEHLSAIAQHLAGQKLRKIEREIKELSK